MSQDRETCPDVILREPSQGCSMDTGQEGVKLGLLGGQAVPAPTVRAQGISTEDHCGLGYLPRRFLSQLVGGTGVEPQGQAMAPSSCPACSGPLSWASVALAVQVTSPAQPGGPWVLRNCH